MLDRETGEFISGTQFVGGVTWATGLDPVTGRPIESPSGYAGLEPILVSPDPEGAHNWYPMAMDAQRGWVYLGVRALSQMVHAPDREWESDLTTWNLGMDAGYDGPLLAQLNAAPPPRGELLAWDPVGRREAWRVVLPVSQSGGVLATAGNLFQGRADGFFAAYRASDGEKLWEFDAGTGIMAPPVTYLVADTQYVTVMAGWGGPQGLFNSPNMGPVRPGWGRILTFALGGAATLSPPAWGHGEPPVPAIRVEAAAAMLKDGKRLYDTHCAACHGSDAIAGPLPDLRYSTAETHAQLDSIVLGGARRLLGMPAFGDLITADELKSIQAYILSRAEPASGD